MRNGFGNKQNLDSFTPSREMLITRGPDLRQKTIMQNEIPNIRRSAIFKKGSWKRVPNNNQIVFMYYI